MNQPRVIFRLYVSRYTRRNTIFETRGKRQFPRHRVASYRFKVRNFYPLTHFDLPLQNYSYALTCAPSFVFRSYPTNRCSDIESRNGFVKFAGNTGKWTNDREESRPRRSPSLSLFLLERGGGGGWVCV